MLEAQNRRLSDEVAAMALSQVEGGDMPQTQAAFLQRYTIEPLQLAWEAEDVLKEEVTVERPSDFGGTYKRGEVRLRIHIPFTGDKALFSANPTGIRINLPRAEVFTGYLQFTYQAASHDLQSMRTGFDWDAQLTKQNVIRTNERVADHNSRLPGHIRAAMEARRQKLHADSHGLAALGFKIRRHGEPAATVSFPITRKTVIPLPAPKSAAVAKPDPVMELAAYEDILGNLAGMSIAIERSPTTFAEIGEVALRDWFLVALNGNFRGDATGETFNREGKADISIRVNGGVIFIAECKFWDGEKSLIETVDQLLGYLTWRDSKAAILVFSRNADFTAVLKQIPDVLGKHTHCRNVGPHGESSFRFTLRDKTDPARTHLVTLLAFHIPRTKDGSP
ncbi:MAG: hypothetical protein WC205_00530 [Opitutaceae bacterium]